MTRPEFDNYSASYEELLQDPIRDRFTGDNSKFFHVRKRDLVLDFFRRRAIDSHSLNYLDIGCGKGDLLSLFADDFKSISGCDPSPGMLEAANVTVIRHQPEPAKLPYCDAEFDFVTAVCVYHHVSGDKRLALTREAFRVLRPGGWFSIIEHNPYNPATRLIVSRTPVDSDAVLLRAAESRSWLKQAGFEVDSSEYFLYLPEHLYRSAKSIERLLRHVPLGGQYAVFAHKPAA